ncbi:antitoxin Xre/MbcA/ParS toxin-binding domain-containing protein [Pseudidiomarina sp. CB1]|uniref:antitoxin Xre/MbcA/ParS toxin-binding domain-containing protein n=1 Tax=Pseudidiomarina sp. CB1 TaxID=2972484 RepID=UPI002162616C|nr:antitoxin Xre/MbcA/ParS toxin-binding domain-containing protein [Pseudidiomarina sp. CB1]
MHHGHYIPKPVQQALVINLKEKLVLPENYPEISRAIVKGFKFDIVSSIAHETGLSATEILNALNLPHRTTVQRRKHRCFNTAESNRIYALIEVITAAEVLFDGNFPDAIRWLKKPCKALGKRLPVENVNSFFEFQQVIAVIHRLEYGVFN